LTDELDATSAEMYSAGEELLFARSRLLDYLEQRYPQDKRLRQLIGDVIVAQARRGNLVVEVDWLREKGSEEE
jgi:hypothetical protein